MTVLSKSAIIKAILISLPFILVFAGPVSAAPTLTYIDPTLANNSNTTNNWVYVNVSSTENLSNSSIEVLNSTYLGGQNFTMTVVNGTNGVTNYTYINLTNLGDGTFNYSVYGRNGTGSVGQSAIRFVTVDTTKPTWVIGSNSTNTTTAGATANISVNLSDNIGLSSCIIQSNNSGTWRNGSVITLSGTEARCYNSTFALNSTLGVNISWNVWFNDTAGNANQTSNFSIMIVNIPPTVTLVNPTNAQNFTATNNNVTFQCSATDDKFVWNVSLYHNVSGTFALNQTRVYGEFANDSSTLLLCHFNGNYTCVDGEQGNSTNTSFDSLGKFRQGVLVNDADTLIYNATGNFDRNQGTIEFWVKPYFNVSNTSDEVHFLDLGNISNPGAGRNEFYIYFDGAVKSLYFYIIDSSSINHWVRKNVSGWQVGEWRHVAAVWDLDAAVNGSHRMELYINGSTSDANSGADSDMLVSNVISDIFVGTWTNSSLYQANSTIDELRISNAVRAASEINQSYQNGIANYTSVSANWSMNVSDGNYNWSCLAYDNESNLNWSANYNFTVDINPPVVRSINIVSPNSTDDIDPLVTINVTANVTDAIGVDTVILQWNETGDLTNVTMTCNSSTGICNASFPIDATGGTYYYRIWANDIFGHSNTSVTQNITAEYDYTWTRSPADFGSKTGLLNSFGNIGNLAINNTGDDTLTFSLSDNWPLTTSYNVTNYDTFSFTLAKKTATNVSVNMTFSDSDSENNVTITITASHGSQTPSPTSATASVTLVSQSGGPYLTVTLVTYPTSVTQGDTGVVLKVKVRNIGNETATNTWLNWTLPSGWTNASGNLTQNISTLTSLSTDWNNITADISSSAATGTQTLQASASCGNTTLSGCVNASGVSASVSVTVIAATTTTTTSAGGGGGGGGGGGASTVVEVASPTYSPTAGERESLLRSAETFEVLRGFNDTFSIEVSNPFPDSVLENVTLSAEGYLDEYIKITPERIEEIEYGETGEFRVLIIAPSYLGTTYYLNLTTAGKLSYYNYPETKSKVSGEALSYKNVTLDMFESRIVPLVVHKISRAKAAEILDSAAKDVEDMRSAGFSITRVSKLLEEAKKALAELEYDRGYELGELIANTRQSAFAARASIADLRGKIEEAERRGSMVIETKELLNLVIAAFERGDYATAQERMTDAQLVYAVETKGKINVAKLIFDYWKEILLGTVAASVAALMLYRRITVAAIAGKLESLNAEEANIMNLMKEAQLRFFEKKDMSPATYHKTMYDHEKRMGEIKQTRANLRAKRIGVVKGSGELENLRKEAKDITKLIEEAQDGYFNKRILSMERYERSMELYRNRMAEIEESIAVLEAKLEREKREKGIGRKAEDTMEKLVSRITANLRNLRESRR